MTGALERNVAKLETPRTGGWQRGDSGSVSMLSLRMMKQPIPSGFNNESVCDLYKAHSQVVAGTVQQFNAVVRDPPSLAY